MIAATAAQKLRPRQWNPLNCLARRGGSTSVRACLLTLIAACVLPAVVGVSLLVAQAYRDGKAAMVERATVTAKAAMSDVDDQIRSASAALQVLATSPSLGSGDWQAFHRQATQALSFQSGSNFVLSDLSGQQLVNTLMPFGRALPLHGNPALQRAAIASDRPAVSDLFIGGVTRRPLVAVEVPVVVDGRVAHTLAMGFLPDRFAAVLDNLRPQRDWVISVFDRTGVIVARTQMADRYVGQKGAPALVAAMARAEHGVVETDTLEGIPVVAAFVRSPVTGWTVAVGVPREAMLARLQRWVAALVVATVSVLAVAVFIATLISRRVAGSMDALIAPAQALGRGDEFTVPPLQLAEADAVARALEQASDLLHARTEERDRAARASVASEQQAQRMTRAAMHDPLTDLPNRAGFLRLLEDHLERWERDKRPFALFFVDLDDFKPVNDLHGHLVGDKLLRSFALRLKAGVRASDSLGRLGGDEFAVLVDDVSPQEAQSVASALSARLSSPYHVGHLALRVSACIGVACCPREGTDAQALLGAADAAMYRAKAAGKGRFEMSGFGGL